MTVTFLGHSDAPPSIRGKLLHALTQLIEYEQVERFYVGDCGSFDAIVFSVLRDLKKLYPHIAYYVVLAYMPFKGYQGGELADTIFPAELANVPMRFAIDKRNRWMLKQSDVIITYVTRSYGGAAKFKKIAAAQGKRVIELSQ